MTSTRRDYCYQNTVWSVYNCQSGMNNDYLKRIFEVIHTGHELSSRLLILRFDLHCQKYSYCNSSITALKKFLFSKIERDIGSRSRTYIKAKTNKTLLWAREQNAAESQHYHCALIIDGHLFKSHARILGWIKSYWESRSLGHCPLLPHPYHKLDRHDVLARQKVIYRLSYLAKLEGKTTHTRNYSSGTLKPKHLQSWNPFQLKPKSVQLSITSSNYTNPAIVINTQKPLEMQQVVIADKVTHHNTHYIFAIKAHVPNRFAMYVSVKKPP